MLRSKILEEELKHLMKCIKIIRQSHSKTNSLYESYVRRLDASSRELWIITNIKKDFYQ